MARKSGETDEQWMDRIRASRGLPPQREDDHLMDRTRAAVAFCNTSSRAEALKMSAFLDLFHPEIVPGSTQHLLLMQDARARDTR